MNKNRVSMKSLNIAAPQSSGIAPVTRDIPKELLEAVTKNFPFRIDSVQISDSGGFFLTGWVDDRSSRLQQVRVMGRGWSKTIDLQYIGRSRRPDVEGNPITDQPRFYGLWALTVLDRALIEEKACSVELVLTDGTSKLAEIPIEFLAAEILKARFTQFWAGLSDADRLAPSELTYIEQILRPPLANAQLNVPKHNIESVIVSDDGGIFLNGWIDDTGKALERIFVKGNDGQVTFEGGALARICREDVQTALNLARRHAFGFWGFAADSIVERRSSHCTVDVLMKDGARESHQVPIKIVDQTELRNVILTYLVSSQYLGNPQMDAVACLEGFIGNQIIGLNLQISRKIISQPYVQKFGRPSRSCLGSIVVCLYGKPEYLFLQNALFENRPGIEDYEFIYVCNSPELAERLLREARISSMTYDVNSTLVLLPGNAGFGAANNTAVNFARSKRVLIVNPDIFPRDEDWAMKHTDMVEQLPKEQTDIFGAPLYYDDGSLMHGGMYFEVDNGVSLEQSTFKTMNFLRVEHYGKGAPPLGKRFLRARPVPAITGAFMSLDRGWFEELGGFSEDYVFGHYEDADLCLKSLEKGVATWIHDLKLWHLEGKGSYRLPVHEGASIVNRWLFNKKWADKLIPDMLGQSPKHSLLQVEVKRPYEIIGSVNTAADQRQNQCAS